MPTIGKRRVKFVLKQNRFDEAFIERSRKKEVYCTCDRPKNSSASKIPCDECNEWHTAVCLDLESKKININKNTICLSCRKAQLWVKLREGIKTNKIPSLGQLKSVSSKLGISTKGRDADLTVRIAVFLINSPINKKKILIEGHLEASHRRCITGNIFQKDIIKSIDYKVLRLICKECVGISKGTKEKLVTVFHHFLTSRVPQPKIMSVLNQSVYVIPENQTRLQRRLPLKPLRPNQKPSKIPISKAFLKKSNPKPTKIPKSQVAKISLKEEVMRDIELTTEQKIIQELKLIPEEKLTLGIIEEKMALFTCAELREKCSQVHMTTQGNKTELISRVAHHILNQIETKRQKHQIKKQKLVQKQKLKVVSIKQKLALFTATQLKEECKQANLFTKGNKKQLINRLAQHILNSVDPKNACEKNDVIHKQRKQQHFENCDCELCDLEFAHLLSKLEVSL